MILQHAAKRPSESLTHVPGGIFSMGSDRHYPEERPVHSVRVGAFWIEPTAVTNHKFGAFVAATGYATVAERPLDPAQYPGADPAMLVPGSLVFRKTRGPVYTRDFRHWWRWTPGASWRRPEGPGSDLEGREDHAGLRRKPCDPVLQALLVVLVNLPDAHRNAVVQMRLDDHGAASVLATTTGLADSRPPGTNAA